MPCSLEQRFEAIADSRSLKLLTFEVLGMLDRELSENIKNPVTESLADQLLEKIDNSTNEVAILNDLYTVFWWGDASTIMQAVRCLRTDYNPLYDEKLVKVCAKELLYGNGLFLLNPACGEYAS